MCSRSRNTVQSTPTKSDASARFVPATGRRGPHARRKFHQQITIGRWHGGWNASVDRVTTHARLMSRLMAIVIAGLAVEYAEAVPRLLCYPVMPGDTVTSIAIRLTRDPQGWRGSGFQILDPAAARIVAKSEYGRIRVDWHACLVETPIERAASARHPLGTTHLWLLILACSAGVMAWLAIDASLAKMKATSQVLETFGAAFIREFERPLIDERSARPVLRSELALAPDRRALEVLLAPA